VRNTPGAAAGRGAPSPGTPGTGGGPPTPMTPVASSRPGQVSGPPWEPLPAASGGSEAESQEAEPGGNEDIKGLPRRVKQASLAPQLRASPPPRRTTVASAAPSSGSAGPSPAEIRQTMSALQRGWQQGRSQRMGDLASGSGQPPGAPAADGAGPDMAADQSGPGSSPGGGRHDSTTDEEARGSSDGS